MSSAVKVILGVSVLAMAAGFAGCDSGSGDTPPGPVVVAGNGNTGTAGSGPQGAGGSTPSTGGGTSAAAGSGTGGSGTVNTEGVPITPKEGWIAQDSNVLGIQGAAFTFADTTSTVGLTDNLKDATATEACFKGTAAKVDMASDVCVNKTFTPPATDCYGQYWGAALGFNLNQTIDMTLTPPAGGTPMAFDASQIEGFSFDITDHADHTGTVPAPKDLRFKVDDGTNEFCNPSAIKVVTGTNKINFSDLISQCWMATTPPQPNATTVQSKVIKISWQVVTNSTATVPFDFCVANVRAILKPGAVINPPAGTGGSSSGTGGSAPAAGGSAPAAGGSAPSGGSAPGGSSSGGASAGSAGG